MKKIIIPMTALAVILLGSFPSGAEPQREVLSAGVTTTGDPIPTSFTLTRINPLTGGVLRNQNTLISFIDAKPSDGWKISNVALKISWAMNTRNSGIQIYTDNMNADANPRFQDPTPPKDENDFAGHNLDSNPAGLLEVDPASPISKRTLPMAWSIHPSTRVVNAEGENGLMASDPNSGPEDGAANRARWLFIKDQNTPAIHTGAEGRWQDNLFPAFQSGEVYATMITRHGIQSFATNYFPPEDGNTAVIYLQADFRGAAVQTEYRTNQLVIEGFSE